MGIVLLALAFAAMWWLMIRPQQARLKAQRELMASLAAGDRVITAGGIVGTITVVNDDELQLEVSPGIELTVVRGAVSGRVADRTEDEADALRDDPGEGD
jgi:preprotein translocase subunit YajC